ncbi:MAG: hypothetical protein R3D59_10385 [Paracoccaceae bacterium]
MHGQKVRSVGEKASVEWWDEHPNRACATAAAGRAHGILDRGMPYLDAAALAEDRIGPGHLEGLFEAWSNLYARFALAMEGSRRPRSGPGR